MTIVRKAEAGVFAALLLALGVSALHARSLQARLTSALHARDSLALNVAADSAAIQGWTVKFADTTQAIGKLLARQDSEGARLSASLGAAHAHEVALTDIVAGLKDSLTSVASRVDTVGGAVRYSGALNDGLLTGTWSFTQPSLSLAYSAHVPIQILTTKGGDGRWLVTARATDPRASVTFSRVVINPPPPVIEHRGPSWWWLLAAFGGGWLGRDALSAIGH